MAENLQRKIQALLDDLVAQGKEQGAQVAVYQDGRELVHAWAGLADARTGRAVDGETLFPVFSTMKGVLATVVHLLAERGQLNYDTPIALYWPAFGAQGKERVTLRHGLSHTAGIPYLPDEGISPEQLNDWDFMCRTVANQKPAWPPGTRQFYHAHTLSWILGEPARQADGRPFPLLLKQEISRPLGHRGLFAGLPPELDSRLAWIEAAPDFTETLSPPPRTNAPCMCPAHEWINRPEARRACHPAANGIATARALARHYAALLPGGVDGVELLPPRRVRLMTELQAPEGAAEGSYEQRGLGYQLGTHVSEMGNNPAAFGHCGHGGSVAFADPVHRLAVAVVRNRFSPSSLSTAIWREISTSLGISS